MTVSRPALRFIYLIILFFSVLVNIQEFALVVLNAPAFAASADEVLALLSYPVGLYFLRGKQHRWVLSLLLFPILSMVYGVVANFIIFDSVYFQVVAIQSVINSKFFLYFVIFYSLYFYTPSSEIPFRSVLNICLVVSLIGLLSNLVVPSMFVYSDAEYVLDRQRLIGFQYKPNDLSILLSIYFLYLVLREQFGGGRIWFALFLLGAVVFSTSRTALFICFLGFLVFFLRTTKARLALFLVACSALFYVLVVADLSSSFIVSETVSNFSEFSAIENSQYIRFIMLYYGFYLAAQYFPFGVGPGGFGTVMSVDSPVYGMLGLSRVHFFEDMSGVFDSNVASILGEYGFLGLILFFWISYLLFSKIFVGRKSLVLLFVAAAFFIAIFQPLFSYQVNSINLLLLAFAIAEERRQRRSVISSVRKFRE